MAAVAVAMARSRTLACIFGRKALGYEHHLCAFTVHKKNGWGGKNGWGDLGVTRNRIVVASVTRRPRSPSQTHGQKVAVQAGYLVVSRRPSAHFLQVVPHGVDDAWVRGDGREESVDEASGRGRPGFLGHFERAR